VTAMRHEAHVFLVLERKTPFDRRDVPRIQSLIEKYIEERIGARVLKVEVRVF